jgi:hypothetical protein
MEGKFQLVRDGDYPGTGLPVFKVYDAEEYNDPGVRYPRPVGEVWGVGVRGVTGKFVPTGVRYQLAGSEAESPVFPVGAYGTAARAMLMADEADYTFREAVPTTPAAGRLLPYYGMTVSPAVR